MTAIQRQNLSSQVLEEVRRLILEGGLKPGSRIVESRMAADLEVSRTPLREALHSLEREGLVTSEPGRGFLVPPLVVDEVQELYPLRALLEPLALRLSGLPDNKTLLELRALTQRLANTAVGQKWVTTDTRWHAFLVHRCPNHHLLRLIRDLHRHTQRYEFAFMRSPDDLPAAIEQRQRVLAELEAGDLEEACSQLADSVLVDVEAVLEGLNRS